MARSHLLNIHTLNSRLATSVLGRQSLERTAEKSNMLQQHRAGVGRRLPTPSTQGWRTHCAEPLETGDTQVKA